MMQRQNLTRFRFIPSIDESALLDSGPLAFGWWLEETLARVRWCAVPTCVLTVFLFLEISAWLLLLPAFGYGFGNIAVTWYLRQPHTLERLRSVRALATTIDWLSAFGSIYAFSVLQKAWTLMIGTCSQHRGPKYKRTVCLNCLCRVAVISTVAERSLARRGIDGTEISPLRSR